MDDRMQQRIIGYMKALQEAINKQQIKGSKSKSGKNVKSDKSEKHW